MDTRQNKKLIIIIAAAVSVILLAAAVVCIFTFTSPERRLAKQLELGNKFLNEQDYTQAAAAFTKAIQIDPSAVDAYLGAADAYIGLNELENAVSILQNGIDALSAPGTSSSDDIARLQAKLDTITVMLAGSSEHTPDDIQVQTDEFVPPYYEMPFGPGDIKIGGYNIFDSDFRAGLKALFSSSYPGIPEDGNYPAGAVLFNDLTDDDTLISLDGFTSGTDVVRDNYGYGIVYCDETGLSIHDYSSDEGKTPVFSSFFDYYGIDLGGLIDTPEMLQFRKSTYDDLTFLNDLRSLEPFADNYYIVESQYGKIEIYEWEKSDEVDKGIAIYYTMDTGRYDIILHYDDMGLLSYINSRFE